MLQRYELVITQAGNYMQSDPEGDYVLYDEAKAIEEELEIAKGEAACAYTVVGHIQQSCVNLRADNAVLREQNSKMNELLVKLRTEVADYREALEQIHVRALLKNQVRVQAIADAVLLKYDDLKEPEVER